MKLFSVPSLIDCADFDHAMLRMDIVLLLEKLHIFLEWCEYYYMNLELSDVYIPSDLKRV